MKLTTKKKKKRLQVTSLDLDLDVRVFLDLESGMYYVIVPVRMGSRSDITSFRLHDQIEKAVIITHHRGLVLMGHLIVRPRTMLNLMKNILRT